MLEHEGPFCYRCGRKREKPVHKGPIDFKFGKAITVQEGKDLSVIFTGTVGYQALQAVEALEKEGIHCRLISMHTVKPIDRDAILAAAEETGGIVTVEEHNLIGGLGGAVAEVLCDAGVMPKKFHRIGLPDEYPSLVGTHNWLLDKFGLSGPKIAAAIKTVLGA